MRWKIWPRQYGKTHQLREWWLEDPEHRVILCGSEVIAENNRHYLRPLLEERYYENTTSHNRRLVRNNIVSYRTWLGYTDRGYSARTGAVQLAVDDLDYTLSELFHAHVVYAAGTGSNDIPDPEHADMVARHHKRHRAQYGNMIPEETLDEELGPQSRPEI